MLAIKGAALLFSVQEPGERFAALFDRAEEYRKLREEISTCHAEFSHANVLQMARQARELRKSSGQIVAIDFCPGDAREQVNLALKDLETAISRALAPDEPNAHAHRAVSLCGRSGPPLGFSLALGWIGSPVPG